MYQHCITRKTCICRAWMARNRQIAHVLPHFSAGICAALRRLPGVLVSAIAFVSPRRAGRTDLLAPDVNSEDDRDSGCLNNVLR